MNRRGKGAGRRATARRRKGPRWKMVERALAFDLESMVQVVAEQTVQRVVAEQTVQRVFKDSLFPKLLHRKEVMTDPLWKQGR